MLIVLEPFRKWTVWETLLLKRNPYSENLPYIRQMVQVQNLSEHSLM